MAERRRYNKAATVGKPATPGSPDSSMAPPTDMESTTTDTLERDLRQPNTASLDPVEVSPLFSHLTLDDLDDEGSANDSAKDMNAGKLAMKMSSATNTTSDPPTSTALRPSRDKLPTTDTQCLFHADGSVFKMANIVLSMAPINSTGDIYHILAYLFLAECCIPRVILTHDGTNTTQKSVKRCIEFTTCFVTPVEIEGPQQIKSPDHAYHQNVRQFYTLTYIAKKLGEGAIYIDQKACTTYIAHECHCLRQGRDAVTATLRNKFSQYECDCKDDIRDYAEYWTGQIKEQRGEREVFIMHIRRSSGANRDQDVADAFHLKISDYLHFKKYFVCYIYADQTKPASPIGKNEYMVISPFAMATGKVTDYGKLLHLQLLLTLKEEEKEIQLKGIIGNTSGTLDLAAFIGHRVFNIHTLGKRPSKRRYQDCRVIMQQEFFTLGFYQKKEEKKLMKELQQMITAPDSQAPDTTLVKDLWQWIEGQMPPAKKIDGNPNLEGEGFWQLFYACDVSNKYSLNINIGQTIATKYDMKLPEGY